MELFEDISEQDYIAMLITQIESERGYEVTSEEAAEFEFRIREFNSGRTFADALTSERNAADMRHYLIALFATDLHV